MPGARQDPHGGNGKKGGSGRSHGTGGQHGAPHLTWPLPHEAGPLLRWPHVLELSRHKVLTEISLVSAPKCHRLCSFSHHQEECVPSSVSSSFPGHVCDLLSQRDYGTSPTVQVRSPGCNKPCSLGSAQGTHPPRDPPPRHPVPASPPEGESPPGQRAQVSQTCEPGGSSPSGLDQKGPS